MELAGNSFILRNWQPGDEASLQKHANNPNVSAYLLERFPYPYSMDDARAWVKMHENQQPVVNFAISIDGVVAGGIGLDFRTDIYRHTPLLGYWLGVDFWGKGVMTEVVKLITQYAFEQLDVISIHAYVLSGNPASMRVLEKAGYEERGILPYSVVKYGKIMDEHIFTTSNYRAFA